MHAMPCTHAQHDNLQSMGDLRPCPLGQGLDLVVSGHRRSPYLHHNGCPGDRLPEEDSEGTIIALIEIVCQLPLASWEQGVNRMKCA